MIMEKKLKALRKLLANHRLTGYLQPVHDEYLSEYPPACNQRVGWLTGFSGSAGTAIVLQKKAAIFTDGRYTLQAKNEVSAKLFEQHNSGETTPEAWLAERLKSGNRIGYDPKLYTKNMLWRMERVLGKKNIRLVPVKNLVDAVWAGRPSAPSSPLFIHDIKYAGEKPLSKRQRMAKQIKAAGADACVITAPDAVCWLLGMRGSDVPCTPLVLSAAILYADAKADLFVAPERCDAYVRTHLGKQVKLCAPESLGKKLQALGKKRVLCDPGSLPVWFTQVLRKTGATIIEGENPIIPAKAVKNPVELQGMREAHIIDGVAVVKLLCWLDQEAPCRPVTELEISDKLLRLRAAHTQFVEPSFPTIAGSGPNGAIVHYRVSAESNRTLQKNELMLLDSGGQYPGGTTDITRTVPVGTPTPEHKDRFTRVLRGHIAIATARFPEGTAGSQLDAMARQYLWQAGLDYDHGTGHGVGCFLGVHEGPQRISKRGGDAALKPGMIVSNEPGYYKTGAYGIRIENLVAVITSPLPLREGAGGGDILNENTFSKIPPLPNPPPQVGREYLRFETITCVPIDTRLVDAAMLAATEKQWLNTYHAWVLGKLTDKLDAAEREWLAERCKAV